MRILILNTFIRPLVFLLICVSSYFEAQALQCDFLLKNQIQILSQSDLKQLQIFQTIRKAAISGRKEEALSLEADVIRGLNKGVRNIIGRMGGKNISESFIVRDAQGTLWIWKPETITDFDGTIHKVANSEVMAYTVDRRLGGYHVPPTIYGKLNGKKGTFQLIVGNIDSLAQKVDFPEALMGFDYLIGNRDRTKQNYLITDTGLIIAIDNGNSANSWLSPQIPRTIYRINDLIRQLSSDEYANSREENLASLRVLLGPDWFYENLLQTSSDEWNQLLAPHMNRGQRLKFLERRQNLLNAIQKGREFF